MKKLLALSLLLVGCTDTDMASMEAYGRNGHIICYSADKVILDTTASGRIQTVQNSDGWEFKDGKTGHFIRVSGPCVIEN